MNTSEIRPAAYQLVPLSKVVCNGLKALLIADGVGLGKTISASFIAIYFSEIQKLPTCVVCSPILVTKWLTELRWKFGVSAFAVRSREDLATANNEAKVRPRNFYILSTSLFPQKSADVYPEIGTLIFDEIQYFRNNNTKSYVTALALARRSNLRIGLSATPINNSINDLASELALLLGEANWNAVSAAVADLWSWNKGRITTPLVTRFAKEKLGMHFARRHVRMEPVRFPESYAKTVDRVLQKTGRGSNIYEIITYLRMAASSPSIFLKKFRQLPKSGFEDPKPKLVQSILDTSDVNHWLIFVEFEGTAKYLASAIRDKSVFMISGQTPMFERDDIIESFRMAGSGVLILTPVGGEGLDLQFCQGVINYDLHWNPMKIEQRIGRIDRIGQTKADIQVVNIRVVDSIDDRVLRVITKKLSLTEKSIFATGDVVPPKGRSVVSLTAVQNRALESELDESNRLLSALRYSNEIGQEDYELLDSVNVTYCITSKLKEAANTSPLKTVWLRPIGSSDLWGEKIREAATQFLGTLRGYK